MNSANQFAILAGPSKFDLATALFSSMKPDGKTLTVTFEVQDPTIANRVTVEVIVNGAQAEDGSRESWNIEGFEIAQDGKPLKGWSKVRIYFRTDRRTGHLKFVS